MSAPFIGEIKLFSFNWAPKGWALCQSQLLPIAQYTALFALLGTYYGGNGVNTFALPDLRGRVAIHQGNNYVIGEIGGQETVTLIQSQLPVQLCRTGRLPSNMFGFTTQATAKTYRGVASKMLASRSHRVNLSGLPDPQAPVRRPLPISLSACSRPNRAGSPSPVCRSTMPCCPPGASG